MRAGFQTGCSGDSFHPLPRDEVRVMVQALGKLMGSQGGDGIDLLGGGGEGDLVPGRWLQAILVCFQRMANRYLIGHSVQCTCIRPNNVQEREAYLWPLNELG